jgi:hypothetical protein
MYPCQTCPTKYAYHILACLTLFRILGYEIELFPILGYETLHKDILVTKGGLRVNYEGLKSKIHFYLVD